MKKNKGYSSNIDLYNLIVYNRKMENTMIQEFADMINSCEGRVAFVTDEGDRLVADSMLSALVGFKALLSVAETSPLRVECERTEDCERITGFMMKNRLGMYRRI